ncbi:hypothetical protein PF004_g28583 [Phytophthora fragariae]|uniref:Integrase catalytic domain-containing protein n=2 Tax=Phytophthora fragariae TaxID=53985 RepID=A0A6G0MIB7_9STRA|nr:hypothetical protein PF004_g28583 [Phytophthora fragariae]
MVQEVLQSCHDSLEGGHQGINRTYHRVKSDYYWIGLYADVEKHVRSCPDCCSSKSRPQLRGYSPGNVLAERPFQMVSMDFVIPLPKSRRGNTALLLFQCSFTGFVMGKAMSDTTALVVAQAFEECVYRRFGAPSLIRHDRDSRFMSEVFQAFAETMQSRSRATLSYRPQANGQQERSVKTVMQSVRVYAEDPLQQNWDEIAEKLIFAINNSQDGTRKETPFYLVHGWDAQSTLKAMSSSLKRGSGRQSDALAWRREVNRQQEIALSMAKEYQATEKARRAKEHNETLGRKEKESLQNGKLRLASSKASGGVRARAWQAAAGQQQAASGSVVAASELEHAKLRLTRSKRRRGWWRRPSSSMASCGWPAASGVEAGGGVRARAWQAVAGQQQAVSGTRDRRWWRRPRRGFHAAAPQQQGVSGSVAVASGGVRAADGNLPLPSRRFMTPEVGRSWRY